MKRSLFKSKRNLFMSATLMFGLLTATFQFKGNTIHWLWEGNIQTAVILGITAIIFGFFWFLENRKAKKAENK
ncbi:MAG: hypothetical protein DRI94_11115 [Bacteroidetes bacterium]|nr:MAG: hypothetical protein DRI94_11115 [Bacteroidota bacterium]